MGHQGTGAVRFPCPQPIWKPAAVLYGEEADISIKSAPIGSYFKADKEELEANIGNFQVTDGRV